eukprot:GHVS01056215.1.p2 GENE.GHVS01056215.1~~GHVS01056215.1.p2  ORF type:complete len:105 (-),score=27.65 GHVS01056215.1:439-753(-)
MATETIDTNCVRLGNNKRMAEDANCVDDANSIQLPKFKQRKANIYFLAEKKKPKQPEQQQRQILPYFALINSNIARLTKRPEEVQQLQDENEQLEEIIKQQLLR